MGEVSEALALGKVSTHAWHIERCCALDGTGLSDGLDWVISAVTGGLKRKSALLQ